jgi:hypothetical protein
LGGSGSWRSKNEPEGAQAIDSSSSSIGLFDYLLSPFCVMLGRMSITSRRLLFWTPRILCILFAVFLSLFALDVFDEHLGFWKTLLALAIHLVPTWIVLGVLALTWRREWVGAILFNLLALWYLVTAWGRFHWSAYALISGPLCVVGILFLLNWIRRADLRPSA